MKDPWEVFYDSFRHHARKVNFSARPWKEDSPDVQAILNAFRTAGESTAYHLIETLHWRGSQARQVMEEFEKVGLEWVTETEGSFQDLRERLRHQWTDWQLKSAK